MLKEGDIIEIIEGDRVYATVPQHFLYTNRRGVFDKFAHGEVRVAGDMAYLAGRYVVYKTSHDGGGTGHGSHDVYPSGHHVFCEKLDNRKRKVDFYQTGCFTCMIPDREPVGKATRQWTESNAETVSEGVKP